MSLRANGPRPIALDSSKRRLLADADEHAAEYATAFLDCIAVQIVNSELGLIGWRDCDDDDLYSVLNFMIRRRQ